jgi:hypothetical protein
VNPQYQVAVWQQRRSINSPTANRIEPPPGADPALTRRERWRLEVLLLPTLPLLLARHCLLLLLLLRWQGRC